MVALFERVAPLWLAGRLRGKVGAAFVSAGEGERGGGELALLALFAWLAENGILLVPMHNREPGFRDAGCHWGPLARTNPKGGEPGPSFWTIAGGIVSASATSASGSIAPSASRGARR